MAGFFLLKGPNAKAFAIENTLRLDWSMGPIVSGTKGTHELSC